MGSKLRPTLCRDEQLFCKRSKTKHSTCNCRYKGTTFLRGSNFTYKSLIQTIVQNMIWAGFIRNKVRFDNYSSHDKIHSAKLLAAAYQN